MDMDRPDEGMLDCIASIEQVRLVRLATGDDILVGLRRYVDRHRIRNALVLGGFGSVSSFRFHVVASTALPPAEAYPQGDRALDIAGMSGAVLDGRVHAHITFTDDRAALGGHLEEGCRVLTFAVISLGILPVAARLGGWDRLAARA